MDSVIILAHGLAETFVVLVLLAGMDILRLLWMGACVINLLSPEVLEGFVAFCLETWLPTLVDFDRAKGTFLGSFPMQNVSLLFKVVVFTG